MSEFTITAPSLQSKSFGFEELAHMLNSVLPDGPEKTHSLICLEDCMTYATQSLMNDITKASAV